MSNKTISVYSDALKRKADEEQATPTQESTPKVTWTREPSSDPPREKLRDPMREKARERPSRDDVQEFSFRLRDELKVKVQAEVPYSWQKELEQIALQMNVKKLELYRFILGKFLNKV
jgi:hypothetical protein